MATYARFLSFLLLTSVSAAPQASQALSSTSIPTSTVSTSPSSLPSLTSSEREELFDLHEKLVNIPSISNEELKCAEYISQYLEELGYYVEKVPVGNTSTYNVLAYPTALKEQGIWPEVLITSHIDTVCTILVVYYSSSRLIIVRYLPSTHSSEENEMAQSSTTVVGR
jgi:acetylornithine deacetylase